MEVEKKGEHWEKFEDYVVWLSLPKQPISRDEMESLGYDEEMCTLMLVRTKKAYSEYSGVPYLTLVSWDKDPKVPKLVKEAWRKWARKLTPSVIGRLYQKVMEEGDAPRVKAWQSFIEQEADKVAFDAGFEDIAKNIAEDGDALEEKGN